MKLHLCTTNDHRQPFLMLWAYTPEEVERLCLVCRDLAEHRIDRYVLHEQPWIEAAKQCQFIWQYWHNDIGVLNPAKGQPFVLRYSEEAWLEVEAKLAVMREPKPNQLNELTMEGEILVVISPDARS